MSYKEWMDKDTGRPKETHGRDGGTLSNICEVLVCPEAARKMKRAATQMHWKPPGFSMMEMNCSSRAGEVLSEGGLAGYMVGMDTPQKLINQMVEKHGAKCRKGYTRVDRRSNATVEYQTAGQAAHAARVRR